MLQAAPPIQSPDPSIIAELCVLIDSGSLGTGGPVLCYDKARSVFLTVVIDHGVMVHWQIEACRDQQEADALRSRYSAHMLQEAAELLRRQASGQPTSIFVIADVTKPNLQ